MSKARILIVEDEGVIAADIEDRLKRLGYLLKPFNERELVTTIEMALYKHQLN